MAKRRAEDTLLCDSPSKRCYRSSLCRIDVELGSIAPSGGVSPPSLLALLGSRGRKRPHYFEGLEAEEKEAALCLRQTYCDMKKHAAHVWTSGSFHERHTCSTLTSSKKRAREDCTGAETVCHNNNNKKVDENTSTEDCTYNSFQYWRTPLPELDLSLLEENDDHSQAQGKTKVIDTSSDSMET